MHEAARQQGTADDPKRFKEQVGELVKHKLAPDVDASETIAKFRELLAKAERLLQDSHK